MEGNSGGVRCEASLQGQGRAHVMAIPTLGGHAGTTPRSLKKVYDGK
jgi:hypothetical protein